MTRRLLLSGTLLWTLTASGAPPEKEQFHIFLLAGQSNMAGRGVVEAEDVQPHPRVLVLNRDQEWAPAIDPLHFDKPSAGVGPGRAFGIAVAKANPGITVGLVPCAVGGSGIDKWIPGAFDAPTKTHPWDDCLARARVALKSGVLKGILWHQGEGDSNPELAPGYAAKLAALVARFREALKSPNVPFLAGQLGQFPDTPWSDSKIKVDRAHQDLPATIPHTAFVSSKDLHDKGDKLHFDAPSCREFGARYAAAYLKLIASSSN